MVKGNRAVHSTAMTDATFHFSRNIRLFYAFGFMREFSPILAIWVVYLTDFRDLTLAQVGLMEGLFFGVRLVMEVPSGAFADRFGRRASFITGAGLEASAVLVFAVAGDFAVLTASYVLWATGLSFRTGNDEAYLYDSLLSANREREYSDRIGVFTALATVAMLLGTVAGGVIADVTDLQVAVLAGVAPFALALPVLAVMQEPPRRGTAHASSLVGTLGRGLSVVRRRADIRSILLLEVALSATLPAWALLSQPFLERHDVRIGLFGVLMIPTLLARIGGGLVSGRLTRRIGLTRTLAVAIAAASGGMLIAASIDHVAAFAGIALAVGGVALALPAIGGYVNDRTDSDVRATVLSIAPMGTSVMMAVMSTAAGVIGDSSLRLAFLAIALVVLLGGAINLAAWRGSSPGAPAPRAAPVDV
jgi:MFS family permease